MGRANGFAPEGGLDAEELPAVLGMVRERFDIAAAGIASCDPAFDADGRVLRTAPDCVRMLTPQATPAAWSPDLVTWPREVTARRTRCDPDP